MYGLTETIYCIANVHYSPDGTREIIGENSTLKSQSHSPMSLNAFRFIQTLLPDLSGSLSQVGKFKFGIKRRVKCLDRDKRERFVLKVGICFRTT